MMAMPILASAMMPTARHALVRAPALAMSAAVDAEKTFKRAEFWDSGECTLTDIANVIGRWESSKEWMERSQFSVLRARRVEDAANRATLERYEYAQRNDLAERIALQQNVPKLPFKNERLAATFGKSLEDFEAMPVSTTAIDVVFDSLVQSKSGLINSKVCDERRAKWMTASGGIDGGAIEAGLLRSRVVVCFSWIFFGKGRLYGFALATKLAIDAIGKESIFPPAVAPYADYILLAAALVLGYIGIRSQADVYAKTGEFETVSYEEALADKERGLNGAPVGEEEYSTVFAKWAGAATPKDESGGVAQGAKQDGPDTSFIFPLTMALGSLLLISSQGPNS